MKPFLAGRRTLDSAPLRSPHIHKPASKGQVQPLPDGPAVEVVREGDKIVRIVVTCSCGEKVEVECLYPAGS